jgi:hypothetical protein
MSRTSTPSSSTAPSEGSISRVSSLANVDFPEPVSPTIATRVPAAMSIVTSRSTSGPAGYAKLTLSKCTSMGPRGSVCPSGPGSTRSAGVSRMPITRRHPAMAFCASVRIWVPICTGPTNSDTRNAKASTLPAVISPAKPSQMPTTSTPAFARPAETPPSENENAVKPWARVLAAWCRAIASSMRRWVRASTAYDRTTAAPTTGSEIADSSSPTWRRTVP